MGPDSAVFSLRGRMQKKSNFAKLTASMLVLTMLATACAKQSVNRAGLHTTSNQQKPDAPTLNEELVPTISEEKLKTLGAKYEEPPKVIQTKQATIQLQQVKMKDVVMKYDPNLRKFSVQGHAFILDENKNEIADNSFSLMAVHASDDANFRLVSTDTAKVSSNLKPVVRAKVTCLSTHEDDSIDCSNAVVDFIIAYKKKIYTEQMESQKPQVATPAPTAPTTSSTPVDPKKDAPAPPTTGNDNSKDQATGSEDNQELQSEKEEQSVLGRYEGAVQTTDLSQEFDDDDEIQTVIKPTPKKEDPPKKTDPKKEQPKKDEPKKPDTSKPGTTPAKPNPTPSPTTPAKTPDVKPDTPTADATPDKKDDDKKSPGTQITPDVAQTESGDVRPTNQAIGLPDQGKLRNATSLLERQKAQPNAIFEVAFPSKQRYYATYEMAEMLTRMGKKINTSYSKTLEISDISQLRGGLLSPHLSHQIGMDADIGYPSAADNVKFPVVVQMSTRSYNSSSYSVQKTYELLKFAYSQSDLQIDRIFADRRIKQALCEYAKSKGELTGADKNLVQQLFKNIEHVDGHGDHFHVRLRCTPAHPACRNKVYVQNNGCT